MLPAMSKKKNASILDATRIVQSIVENAHAQAVFGEAVKLDTHTIVPVAAVKMSGGGGGGGLLRLLGGGGGGNVKVVPLGFITEREGEVTFTPIEIPAPVLQLLGRDGDDGVDLTSKIPAGLPTGKIRKPT